MNALVFGAGNIGRGFLGQLLNESGYAVTFVDANPALVAAINAQRIYTVSVVGRTSAQAIVRDVDAVLANDSELVIRAIVEADVILTAVGKEQLAKVAPTLAKGLVARLRKRPHGSLHVVVVACENMQENTDHLRSLVLERIPADVRDQISEGISFPNCVIDRIVPNVERVPGDDPLGVTVEEYFQLAIDQRMLNGEPPPIQGLVISPNLTAVLEQKLFTLNMAHAVVAFWGYLRGCEYIHEAVMEVDIRELMSGALGEVSTVLVGRHDTITEEGQRSYAERIVQRFENQYLRDRVTRVARDPRRKLGVADRLVFPALCAEQVGVTPAFLSSGIAGAFHYDFAGDEQARSMIEQIRTAGISRVLQEVAGIVPTTSLGRLVAAQYNFRAL